MIETKDLIHVALASNRRYMPGLRATVISLIRAASEPERLRFHVFSDGLTDEDCRELEALASRFGYAEDFDYRIPDMSPIQRLFKTYNGSYTTYLRLYFPESLSDLKWVLWTDVDVLWFRDPCALWSLRDESVSVIWSPDVPSTRKTAKRQSLKWRSDFDMRRYGCAGVMLMNLERMRTIGFVRRAEDFVRNWGSPIYADQDVLNEICHDDSKFVDERWDLLYPIKDVGDGVVIHVTGIGSRFGAARFNGWFPAQEIWFRYVAEVLDGRRNAKVCAWWKRFCYTVIAWLYPIRRPIAFVTDPIHPWVSDFIQRNLLFSWLRKKQLWK